MIKKKFITNNIINNKHIILCHSIRYHKLCVSTKSLSETFREPFGNFEYESDAEETRTLAVESVPVPSNNILATDLRISVCNKRKRHEPGDPHGMKTRPMGRIGVVTDSESDGKDTMIVVGVADSITSNNILEVDLQRPMCNKQKRQEPDDTSEKRMRLMEPVDVKLIDSDTDVEHAQTVVSDPRSSDG
jgi:hypothetical protein